MKKIFALMLMLSAVLTFSSCGDDKDEPSTGGNNTTTGGQTNYAQAIIGSWDVVQISYDGLQWIPCPWERTSATFNADGTYYGAGNFGSGHGTYTIQGSVITTRINGEVFMLYTIMSLNGSSATLKMSEPQGGHSIYIKAERALPVSPDYE